MVKTHYNCPCLETCPLSKSMEIVGGKWKMQIICSLNSSGATRYNQLKKKMDGVSNTVLSKALKELEESGLIVRKEYLEVPIRVEYETTDACDALIPILDSLGNWYEKFCSEKL
ncbi:MAG: helix-turn-helix domain-containing protein [Hornefia sp.]|nr:helix-turn-helix domain-containing protein [Hornefia sp.]